RVLQNQVGYVDPEPEGRQGCLGPPNQTQVHHCPSPPYDDPDLSIPCSWFTAGASSGEGSGRLLSKETQNGCPNGRGCCAARRTWSRTMDTPFSRAAKSRQTARELLREIIASRPNSRSTLSTASTQTTLATLIRNQHS